VLIVGYGSIGAAVERRLAGFEVDVLRVARGARDGAIPVTRSAGSATCSRRPTLSWCSRR